MDFGVFDHLDRNDLPLADYYEARLAITEAYDRAGFFAYHVAEHHATPLGMAPSPSVFLAAVAQRTKRLRFGPMVYALPLYHPLRLVEEICMLDQMSGGRLDIGFGRGSSPVELAYFGADPREAQALYDETLALVRTALTSSSLEFESERFRFKGVPMELRPVQQPHPPIWYGLHAPESAERAARARFPVICLDPPEPTSKAIARFREAWCECHGADDPLPKIGLGRFIVVAESDEEALAIARRAYPRWHQNFTFLFRRHGRSMQHPRPADFDTLKKVGQGIAGSPATVRDLLARQMRETGANYCVGQFAFGDLTLGETLHSVELFRREVMPALKQL
ncbi:MAG TPA: LLM class flavin-dependent oxidoreductase [Stellaceae bacterium]|nr:LLM class flavin-dependent oxidoreductase [Stellaceae bacterium]